MRKPGNCRSWTYLLLACGMIATLGCDETPTLPPQAERPAAANLPSAPTQPTAAAPAAAPTAPAPPAAAAPPQVAAAPLPDGDPAAGPGIDREKAVRGSGVKGRKYGGGIVTEPVRQYFRLQQATVYEIQIPHAVNLFKAEHDRLPKDWAEFKREILDPASIVLPELPPGERYVWDATQGEVMVERPARPNEASSDEKSSDEKSSDEKGPEKK
jgi:hypothetical protein